MSPVWTPDGRRIIWASVDVAVGSPNLFWQAADGSGAPEQLTTSTNAQLPSSISADGKRLVFFETGSAGTAPDVAVMSLDGRSTAPANALLHTTAAELDAEISPDGHWLAYQSNESGQYQILREAVPLRRWPSIAHLDVGGNEALMGAERTRAVLPGCEGPPDRGLC